MIEIVKELPEGVSLCPDLKNRARFFFTVQYLGYKYYIPATKELIKLMKYIGITIIKSEDTYQIKPLTQDLMLETFLRDLVSSIYLQIRDRVGSEVYQKLSTEIHTGLEQVFEKKLTEHIGIALQKIEDKSSPS